MRGDRGFTLVEMMVVVSIVAILAAVATPAYINYVNRSRQGEAASGLLTARLEMEEFYADNGYYASTIQCLPSFVASANTGCLSSCSSCGAGSAKNSTVHYYGYKVTSRVVGAGSTAAYYQILASRKIYSYAATDQLTISANTDTPLVQNTSALKFSVFKWLFNQ